MPGELKYLPEIFLDLNPEEHEAIDRAVDAMSIEEMVVKENLSFNPEHYRTLLKCALKRDFASWSQYKTEISGKILLRGATLSFIRVRLVFVSVDLQEADLRNVNFRQADLHDAFLCKANLMEANLQSAALRGADLREAALRGADLRGADLRGADLRGADLWGANLRRANLQETDLREANLRGANLQETDLREANLLGAMYDEEMLRMAMLDDVQKIKLLEHGLQREQSFLNNDLQEKDRRIEKLINQLTSIEREKEVLEANYENKIAALGIDWEKKLEQVLKEQKVELQNKCKDENQKALKAQEIELRDKWDEEQKTKEKQEKAADAFIEPVEKSLKKSSGIKRWIGYVCFFFGLTTLVAAVFLIAKEIQFNKAETLEWAVISYRSTRLLAIILMLVAISKYLYSLGRSYTRESIKESDRIHILSYGKFYLQAFPMPESHAERKDIFADWNKASYDSFGDIKIQDIDPKIVELTQSLIQLAKASAKDDKSEKKTGSDS